MTTLREAEFAATPHDTLIDDLLNPSVPKTEREHAAAREIESLRQALAQPCEIEAAVQAEREACARIAFEVAYSDEDALDVSTAIRARGEK